MLQRVRMLITQRGVHDGEIYPETFLEGQEYAIGDELMRSFIDLGAVELVTDGEKSHENAPANKMKRAAPENKAR